MGFFKKSYSPIQLADALYPLCAADDTVNASMLLYAKGRPQFGSDLETRLRWHIYALHLFICDYTCFHKFDDTELRKRILDAFYLQIAQNLSGQPNHKQIAKAVLAEINSYGNAVRGKSLDELLVAVGKVFASSVDEPAESVVLLIAGSGIFTRFSVTINKWLDDVKMVDE